MSNPTYKGPGQPSPTTSGWCGWLGGLFGVSSTPSYKTPVPPVPVPVPTQKPEPIPAPQKQEPVPAPTPQAPTPCDGLPQQQAPMPCEPGDLPDVYALDYGTTVVPVPVGAGPITIVIQPRD